MESFEFRAGFREGSHAEILRGVFTQNYGSGGRFWQESSECEVKRNGVPPRESGGLRSGVWGPVMWPHNLVP